MYLIDSSAIKEEAKDSFACILNNNRDNPDIVVFNSNTDWDGTIEVDPVFNIEYYHGGYSTEVRKVLYKNKDITDYLTDFAKLNLANQYIGSML